MYATIKAVEYYLPEGTLPNSVIASKWPEWTEKKIESKIGIAERHLSGSEEFTSDMAVIAARKLFDSGACTPEQVDFLILCTQTPDYMLPTTACIVQAELGLANTVGAVDISLGCSGYIYSLGYAKGLIETGQAENVLLITADTYTKLIHPDDKSIVTLFGDAASATLVCATDRSTPSIGPFVYGTDGGGANNLIVPNSGVRGQYDANAPLM
ncbi:MAG: 3-oxoacyl-ACP synthase, partial [Armatimonadetes bacterium]|nr:3-oxoacyl-ACP synthase [Armatimonadota bacterium]